VVRALLRGFLTLIGLLVLTYAFFLVPLGQRTTYEHACRILATEPAQELGREASEAAGNMAREAERQWREREAALESEASTSKPEP
jgi:hypothetical protein